MIPMKGQPGDMFEDMLNDDEYQTNWEQRGKRRHKRRETWMDYDANTRRKPKRPKFYRFDDYDDEDYFDYRSRRHQGKQRRRTDELDD